MPENRFFVKAPLTPQTEVTLDVKESHHLLHVMRQQVGDKVTLVNGEGVLAEGQVVRLTKKEATLKVLTSKKEPPPKKTTLLAQALPRFSKLELIVEKASELGLTELYLFPGEKSAQKSLTNSQKEKLKALLIAALKQCGRLYLLKIRWLPPLNTWDNSSLPNNLYFGDIEQKIPLSLPLKTQGGALFFIGPEGGFSHHEVDHLKKIGAQGVHLGPHTLRAETAAIVAASLLTLSS